MADQRKLQAIFLSRRALFVARIQERFRERAIEWFCAAAMAAWGLGLLHPSLSFTSYAYVAFRGIGETNSGFIGSVIGIGWLIGLIINGAKQRVTSTIRMVCAALGAIAFGILAVGIFYGFLRSGIYSTGVASYAIYSFMSLYSLYWTAVDKRDNG